jgi:transcriptional regulator with AAA-type ATPase domain/tetratricopeptide (TPR) repeat protein
MEELAELLGESPAINTLREKLRQLLERQPAGRRLPAILLQGETGTGKGLVARLVHRMGPRKGGPFVDINCPGIPETLLEAELFGFERGAFTDARRAKPGLLHTAHRGTLFLDEVGLLPESAQAKLLTVIEERVVRRLGSTRPEAVDVCFISATNTDLRAALRARRFREDLYHRLAVITLDMPALRDRGRDVLLLAQRFLARACADYGLPPKTLGEQAQARLLTYRWPGNIRELANVMERAALFADSPVVTEAMLEPLSAEGMHPEAPTASASAETVTPEAAMRRYLQGVLEQSAGNISHAAARLGIARNTLYARLEKYGVRGHRGPPHRRSRPEPAPALAPTGTQIQWERRGIALLCAALMEPDGIEAAAHTNRVLEVIVDKLQTFGGRVEELTPTRILASFGVDPVEDAPLRAAHAAMVVHKSVERAREDTSRTPGVKIGIHVAQVLVARSASRVDIDADAQRAQGPLFDQLLQTIGMDETVASAAAAPFLERRFELVPIDGGAGGVDRASRLTGQERRGLGLWGAMTPFVGRHDELEVLQGCLAAAGHGHGQVVAVVGDPGVGKSRILWEFTHSPHVGGWLVLESGAVPYGKTTPYLPAIDLLKAYCGIGARDDQRAIREKVTGKLLALDPAFEEALPAFLTLLDVPVDDSQWHAFDPAGRRRQTLDALERLLLRESHLQPLALVFEDLQWIDGETQALLERLVKNLPGARLLLLVSHRSEYAGGWINQSPGTQLRIDPLPREGADSLLEVLLGDSPGLEPLKRLLVERTEGNPLFVEESVRALVETGALTGVRGDYRLIRELPAIHVPGTVQAILTARVDRLPSEEKRLLEIAAVIGRDFSFALLQAVADEREERLRRALRHLQAAEFLYETCPFPDLEYTFKHALTHEVAYENLIPDRRRGLHARIAETMAHLYDDRLGEHIERLAHHALWGGMGELAVPYLRRAGLKAAGRSALQEARAWFEHAVTVLDGLPESLSTLEQGFEVRLELRRVLNLLGDVRQVLERLREAEILAERLDDDRRRGRVSVFMTNVLALLGELDEALAAGTRALKIAAHSRDLPTRIWATNYLAQAHYYRGDFERVVELATDNIAALPADWVDEPSNISMPMSAYNRLWLVYSLAELGRFAEATRHAAEVLRVAEPTKRPFAVGEAHLCASWIHLHKGDWTRASSSIERGIAVVRTGNVGLNRPAAIASSAWILAQLGEAREALTRLREGEQLLESQVARGLGGHMSLGQAALLLGRLDQARSLAERAVKYIPFRRGTVAHALHLLGEIATHPDCFDAVRGEVHYREALALAEPRAMRPLVAHCHLGLGKLYRRTGRLEQACEYLIIAATMYREMDMQFWLQQAAVETGALGLPGGEVHAPLLAADEVIDP